MSMEPKKTVLIVEDEVNIVDIVRFNLQREGYATLEAYDGEAGLALAREKKPDLILLDVMMPKMMGFDVCRALRAEGDNVPVIILTAREEEEDKILGLEIGADDYITKPFSMRELMARVKANIRRTAMVSGTAAESGMSAGGALTINTDSFQVFKNGKPIELTQREYELLTFLASHPDKVFSRVDLMEQVWNYGYVGDDVRTVDVTVRRLREKTLPGWLARKVSSSYSRCVRSTGAPFLRTSKLSGSMVMPPPALMELSSAAGAESIEVRRRFALMRASSSRMEKGLVM